MCMKKIDKSLLKRDFKIIKQRRYWVNEWYPHQNQKYISLSNKGLENSQREQIQARHQSKLGYEIMERQFF